MINDKLIHEIRKNEGFKNHIYQDIRGFDTIGYGFLVSALTDDEIALNGGVIEPMEREIADAILMLKLEKLYKSVLDTFDWLKDKPENVQNVVIEMCYQMGVSAVKKFATTLHYIRNDEYQRAYENGLKSRWAKQTPKRAERVLSGLLA